MRSDSKRIISTDESLSEATAFCLSELFSSSPRSSPSHIPPSYITNIHSSQELFALGRHRLLHLPVRANCVDLHEGEGDHLVGEEPKGRPCLENYTEGDGVRDDDAPGVSRVPENGFEEFCT